MTSVTYRVLLTTNITRLRTSLMCPLIVRGYVAMTTSVILQFKMKAIMNDATTNPRFCSKMVALSTTTVRRSVASVSRRDESIVLVLLTSSNHPISFLKMAVTKSLFNYY